MLKILLPTLVAIAVNPIVSFANGKQVIYTEDAPYPIGAYSQAIKGENTVYIAGQIPLDPKTNELVKGDFKTQLKQVFKNISAIATAADGDLNDIMKITVYVTDFKNFAVLNEVMQECFDQPYPARAVVEVTELPMNSPVVVESIMLSDN